MEFVATPMPESEDLEEDNIWIAVSNGNLSRVQEILATGVLANVQDEHGYSPLHAAASYEQREIIDLLVNAGGNINIRDNDGDTPLLFAETAEMFDKLVAMGANASVKNTEGEGIVEKVVEDENEDLFEHLVTIGFITDLALIERLRLTFSVGGLEQINEEDEEEWGDMDEGDDNDENNEMDFAAGDEPEDEMAPEEDPME